MMLCLRVRRKAEHCSMLGSQPSRFMHNWGPNRLWPCYILFLDNWTTKKQIPRDNDSIQEVETQDQDVPVVRIPECYAGEFYLFSD